MMKTTDFSKEEMDIIIDALMSHYCNLVETAMLYDYNAKDVQELLNNIIKATR